MRGVDIEEQSTRSSVSFMTNGLLLVYAAWLNSVFDTLRIGLATVEMGCAFIIGRGIKRAVNPFGSVCEPSRRILTFY